MLTTPLWPITLELPGRMTHGDFRDGESIFWKQDRYSYQREFRFVINDGSMYDIPLIKEIGDIGDITLQFESSELNSEKFLGGDMAVPE